MMEIELSAAASPRLRNKIKETSRKRVMCTNAVCQKPHTLSWSLNQIHSSINSDSCIFPELHLRETLSSCGTSLFVAC